LGEPSYPFLVDGETPKPGAFFNNPDLAKTFHTLAREGKDGFYKGRVAEAIVDGMCVPGCPHTRHTHLKLAAVTARGGLMTLEDLAEHETEFVEPISYTFSKEGHIIWECPPNGQGLAALIALGIIDALREEGIVDYQKYEEGSTEWFHVLMWVIEECRGIDVC
jgi:gamma-glutamyltranspeptidase/glutathione hydrolase